MSGFISKISLLCVNRLLIYVKSQNCDSLKCTYDLIHILLSSNLWIHEM